MPDSGLPDPSRLVPRELVSELLAIARASGAEFADVYVEHSTSRGFSFDEGRVKTGSYSVLGGVGVRAIRGDQTGYARSGFSSSPSS